MCEWQLDERHETSVEELRDYLRKWMGLWSNCAVGNNEGWLRIPKVAIRFNVLSRMDEIPCRQVN
jgi:hypothetical protein